MREGGGERVERGRRKGTLDCRNRTGREGDDEKGRNRKGYEKEKKRERRWTERGRAGVGGERGSRKERWTYEMEKKKNKTVKKKRETKG